MKKILAIALTISLIFVTNSCGFRHLYSMKDCNFKFQKVTGVSWAGIDFMKIGTDYNKLDLSTITACTKALAKKDFTLNVALDMNAVNAGSQQAELTGFDYVLYYDNKEVGSGSSTNVTDIVVPAHGGSTVVPVNFKLDFDNLVNLKKPVSSVKNTIEFINDVQNLGKEDTKFKMKIRAHVRMGKKIVKGTYITIQK